VKLEIFSVSGQKVTTFVNSYMNAGMNYAMFDGSNFASGLFFIVSNRTTSEKREKCFY